MKPAKQSIEERIESVARKAALAAMNGADPDEMGDEASAEGEAEADEASGKVCPECGHALAG